MKARYFLFPVLFLPIYIHAQSMSVREIESSLQADYTNLEQYRFSGPNYSFDTLEKLNGIFRAHLTAYISTYPSTLRYPFDSLRRKNMDILTSKDGLFRIYSWNTWLGGTEYDFENVMQYKSGGQVSIKANRDTIVSSDEGYVFDFIQLYSLQANHKTYYLGVYQGAFSSQDVSMGIKIFTIENNRLNDTVRLIKTRSGMQNTLYFNFNFFKLSDHDERPLRLILYDEQNKIISIPVVTEDEQVTKKYIRYRFTGIYFEKMK